MPEKKTIEDMIGSPLLFTRKDSSRLEQTFVHDTYLTFFNARDIVEMLKSGEMTVSQLYHDNLSQDEPVLNEIFDFDGRLLDLSKIVDLLFILDIMPREMAEELFSQIEKSSKDFSERYPDNRINPYSRDNYIIREYFTKRDRKNPTSGNAIEIEGERLIEYIINSDESKDLWHHVHRLKDLRYMNQRFLDIISENLQKATLESLYNCSNEGYLRSLVKRWESPKVEDINGYVRKYAARYGINFKNDEDKKKKKDRKRQQALEIQEGTETASPETINPEDEAILDMFGGIEGMSELDLFQDLEGDDEEDKEEYEEATDKKKTFLDKIMLYSLCEDFPEINDMKMKRIQHLADEAEEGMVAHAAGALASNGAYITKLDEWVLDEDKCIRISAIGALGASGHLNEVLFSYTYDDDRDIASAACKALDDITISNLDSTKTIDDDLAVLLFHKDKAARLFAMKRIHNLMIYHRSSMDPDEESTGRFPSSADMQNHMNRTIGKNMMVTSPTAPAPRMRDARKIVPGEIYDKITSRIASFIEDEDEYVVLNAISALGTLNFFDERTLSVFQRDMSNEIRLEAVISSYKAGCPVKKLSEVVKSSDESLQKELRTYIYDNACNTSDIIIGQKTHDSHQTLRDISKALISDDNIARCLLIEGKDEDGYKLYMQRSKILGQLGKDKIYVPCIIDLLPKEGYTVLKYLDDVFDSIKKDDIPGIISKLTPLLVSSTDRYGISTWTNASRLLARLGHFDDNMIEMLKSAGSHIRGDALDAIAELYERKIVDRDELTKKICFLFDKIKDEPMSKTVIFDISSRLMRHDGFFRGLVEHELKANIHERLMFTRDKEEIGNMLSAIGHYGDYVAEEAKKRPDFDIKKKPYYESLVNSLRKVVFRGEDDRIKFWAYKDLLKLGYFSSGILDSLNDIAVERSGQIDISQTLTGDLLDSMEKIALSESPLVDEMAKRFFYVSMKGVKYINFFDNTDRLMKILRYKHPDTINKYVPNIKKEADNHDLNAAILLLRMGYYDFDFLKHIDSEIESARLNDKRSMYMGSYSICSFLSSVPRDIMLEKVRDKLRECTDENMRKRLYGLAATGNIEPRAHPHRCSW